LREHSARQRTRRLAREAWSRFRRDHQSRYNEAIWLHAPLSWTWRRRSLYTQGPVLLSLQSEEGRNESAVGRHGEDRQHNDATPRRRASRQRSEETREKTRQIYSVTLGNCLKWHSKEQYELPSRRHSEVD